MGYFGILHVVAVAVAFFWRLVLLITGLCCDF